MCAAASNDLLKTITLDAAPAEYIQTTEATGLDLARLQTPDGTVLIQERRRRPRAAAETTLAAPRSYSGSPQMMGLGGLIIIGVLVASYTTKYDAAIGHAQGALAVPAVGFLALQLFLARAALRLYDDVKSFKTLLEFVISRVFRYMPAVVPSVLLGFILINTAAIPGHVHPAMLPANLLLMADLVGVSEIDNSHWRLKIEIIQAVLVAAAWFGPARRHLVVLLTVALGITALSIDGEPARHNMLTLHGFVTSDGYLPLFVFGVALYQLTQDKASAVWRVMLVTAACLAFLSNTPLHGAFVVAALLVLASIAMGGVTWLGRWRWLAHLGEIAFPIYVAHYVLGFAIIHHLEARGAPAAVAIAAAAAAAIAVGKVLNAFVERPIQRRGPAAIKIANHAMAQFAARPSFARLVRSSGLVTNEGPLTQTV